MQRSITRGASANAGLIFHVFVQDSTSTTGAGKASIAYSSFSCRYIRNGEAISGAITPEDITTIGTYAAPSANTNIRIKAVDNTNMIGVYEIQLHADWVNATNSCQSLTIYLTASGAAVLPLQIPLIGADLQSGQLPSAAAVTNLNAVFSTDFGTAYNGTEDMWNANVMRWNQLAAPVTNLNTVFNSDFGTAYDSIVKMWNADVESVKGDTDVAAFDASVNTVLLSAAQGSITFDDLNVTGNVALSDGLTITRTTANQSAISATGDGTGHGMILTGGGGATSAGLVATSNATVSGIGILAVGTADAGLDISGNLSGSISSVTGAVGSVTAGVSLDTAQGAITFSDLNVTNNVLLADGLTIARSTPDSPAVTITGTGNANGVEILSGNGVAGHGLIIESQATNGAALDLGGAGVQPAVIINGNGSGSGVKIVGGATSGIGLEIETVDGDGIRVTAGGSGVDIRADITGDLIGTVHALSGTAVDTIWDELQAGHTTPNTFGYFLDSAVSGVSTGGLTASEIADAVWDELQAGHGTAGTFGYYLDQAVSTGGWSLAQIADAVWDEVQSGHGTAGTFGYYLDAQVSLALTLTYFDSVLNGAETFSEAMDAQGYTALRAALIETLDNKLGPWTGTADNTLLGAIKAALRASGAALPSDIGGTYSPALHSLEASRNNVGTAGVGLTEVTSGSALTAQEVRDAMLLAPGGVAAADSVDYKLDNIEISAGAVLTASVAREDHTWRFDHPDQLTAANTIYEVVNFDGLLAMDLSGVLPTAIQSVVLTAVYPEAGTGSGLDISTPLSIDAETRKIVYLDTTAYDTGTYTVVLTATTGDSQVYTRRGVVIVQSLSGT